MKNNFSYIPSLDGVRGLAVILVFLYHARVPGFMGGLIGVDMFFVLSGYLITALLMHEYQQKGGIDVRLFYIRRAYRLLPALLTFVVLGLLIVGIFTPQSLPAQSLNAVYILTFIYNWIIAFILQPEGTNFTLHCWSLAVEMQYYLLWPLVLLFFLRTKKEQGLTWFLIGMIGVSFLLRAALAINGASIDRIYFATDTRLDGLLLGGLLAHLMSSPATRIFFSVKALIVSLIGLVFLVSYDGFYDVRSQIADPLLAGLFTFVLIGYLLEHPGAATTKLLSSGWLVWLGKISYGLYIWHYPFFKAFRESLSWPQTLLLGSLCSLGCACLSYYLIELPFLSKKKKMRA